jgi:GNAT superfamily N-acetyltransferase
MHTMVSLGVDVRPASANDALAIAGLAGDLAHSFPFERLSFDASFAALVNADDACLLVAVQDGETLGYLLGFRHLTFYANGPVAKVEEILVRDVHRGLGVGRALMDAFEQWARERKCALVALATRRAGPFYQSLGYEASATYLRKLLPD